MFSEFDRLAMTRALTLAERGLETTHPNPRVGCVIAKDDRIVAEGWHERAGEAHAEVAAIRAAKEPIAGATAYVTLEPCSHHGRTPPCVNALIEARIARVVFAVQDPNPRVSGQGADALLRAGITVEAGLMQAEATELNIGFMKRMREGLPWVRVKLAMSLDGRTALANGASQWITSEQARNDVQRWRARCSAVMTGVGTVLADDPQLNVRVTGFKGRQPLRVVLDARLRSPLGAKMFVGLGAGSATGAAAGLASVSTGAGLAAGRTGGAVAVAPAGGAVGAAAGGAIGAAAGATPVAAAPLAGDVLIFTAIGGGVSASGAARSGSAAAAAPAALAGDMAELVNAFETSPTSVAARSADLAGPVSEKTEAPVPAAQAASSSTGDRSAATAAAGLAGASSGAGVSAAGVSAAGAAGAAAGAGGASGPDAHAAVPGASGPLPPSASGAAVTSVPPTLAAAAAVSGAPTPADDATWAGAALSGAIPVRSDGRAPSAISEPATDGRPPVSSGMAPSRTGTGAVSAPTGNSPSTGSAVPPVLRTTPMTPAAVQAGAASPAGAAGAANPAGAVGAASPAGAAGAVGLAGAGAPVRVAGPQASVSPGVPVSAAPGVPAGSAAATGGVVPPVVATAPAAGSAMTAASAQAAGKAPGPGSTGVPAPGADAKSPAPGPAGTPAAGVAATGASDTRGATSAVAGAAPRGGAQMKVAPKADTPAAFQARRAALLARGVRIEEVAADDGFLDLFAVLQKLAELEVNEVLVEAGPTLAGQLLTTFFVDELLLYIAPKLLGPQGRPLVNLPELQSLQDAWGFALFDAKRFGDDLRLRMRPK